MAAAGGEEAADKSVRVRVVTLDGFSREYGAWTTYTINAGHTLQQAVQEAYPLFPGNCYKVYSRRAGERLGETLWKPEGYWDWSEDLYNSVWEGDEVEIDVHELKPGGPRQDWARRTPPGEYDYEEADGAHKSRGPQRARLGELLQRLRASI
jgi:hypothetical protein